MRISALRIEAFGGLRNWGARDLESAPVVCVLGANGTGKTTLFEFIEAALYGFHPATRSAHPRDPWSGEVASGEVELWLDDGSEGVVRRRLPSEPRGQWIEATLETSLGNRPLPACSTVSREMFRSLHALDIDGIASLEGEAWRRIEEKVLGGIEASGLRSAREAAASLRRQGEKLWRADRRGKPLARRKLEERRAMAAQREAAVRRLRREREIDGSLARLEEAGHALEEERRSVEGELESRRVREGGREKLAELRAEIEEARRGAALPVATEGWISAGKVIRGLHREFVLGEEEARRRGELEARIDRDAERLLEWSSGILRDPEEGLHGHAVLDLAPATIRSTISDLRSLLGEQRILGLELERAEDEVAAASEDLAEGWAGEGDPEDGASGSGVDASTYLAWGGVLLAIGLAWTRWEQGGWIAALLAVVLLGLAVLGRRGEAPANRKRGGAQGVDPQRSQLEARRRTRDRLATRVRALGRREKRLRSELEVALSGLDLAPRCLETLPPGVEEALIGIRDLRISIDRARADFDRLHRGARERAQRAEACAERLGIEVEADGIDGLEVAAWLERLEGAEGERVRALEARARLKGLFEQESAWSAKMEAIEAGPEDADRPDGFAGVPTATLERRLASAREEDLERHSEGARSREELRHLAREPQLDEVDGAIACIDEEVEALRDRRDRFELLASILEEALARHRARHQGGLLDRASRWIRRITDGAVDALEAREVDGEPRLFLRTEGGGVRREVAQGSSRGLREQVYLSLRLALAEHCEGGEALPFLLDEVFVTWDAERIGGGLELLREVGRERQLFVFTCREELARRLEAEAGARVLRLPG